MMHVASPFPATAATAEDEVVKPAVEGTQAVLKACQQAKVKRVVLTSSVVAVTGELLVHFVEGRALGAVELLGSLTRISETEYFTGEVGVNYYLCKIWFTVIKNRETHGSRRYP